MMKITLLISVLSLLIAFPAFADKPEWAGKGKPTAEQKEAHKAAMQAKGDDADELEDEMDEKRQA